jgi:N-acetylglutamate synthase-like GNAT family acetyltransferase
MITRYATIDDINEINKIGRMFCEESEWGWEYNEKNAMNSYAKAILHPEMEIICVFDNEKVAGIAIVSTENDFTTKTIGDIIEFYVSPDYRRSYVSSDLLSAVCAWFDARNCVHVFVKSTGNVEGQGKAFENLFKKFSFNVFSSVLVRGKNV